MNIEQMTQKTREALQAAQRIAVEYSNNANTLYFNHMRLYSGELYGNLLLQR